MKKEVKTMRYDRTISPLTIRTPPFDGRAKAIGVRIPGFAETGGRGACAGGFDGVCVGVLVGAGAGVWGRVVAGLLRLWEELEIKTLEPVMFEK